MKNKSVYIAFIGIAIIAIIFGVLNAQTLGERVSLQKNAEIVLKSNGEKPVIVTMTDLEEIGFTDFKANLKRNGEAPVEYTYSGVLLKDVYEKLGIDINDETLVTANAKAVDGYTTAIPLEKIRQDNNVYIAVMREGVPLKGREDDGSGPYQIIISKDKFSQFWCKWAVEVDLQ